MSSLIVLDPTDEARPAARTVGPRPDDLAGRTVGLLDISKPRGEVFLDPEQAVSRLTTSA